MPPALAAILRPPAATAAAAAAAAAGQHKEATEGAGESADWPATAAAGDGAAERRLAAWQRIARDGRHALQLDWPPAPRAPPVPPALQQLLGLPPGRSAAPGSRAQAAAPAAWAPAAAQLCVLLGLHRALHGVGGGGHEAAAAALRSDDGAESDAASDGSIGGGGGGGGGGGSDSGSGEDDDDGDGEGGQRALLRELRLRSAAHGGCSVSGVVLLAAALEAARRAPGYDPDAPLAADGGGAPAGEGAARVRQ